MSSPDIYHKWKLVSRNIVDKKIKDWKRLPDVVTMLEHVSFEYADIYLQNLLNEGVNPQIIRTICAINDEFGNADIRTFRNDIYVSPSSIRYFRHAYDICNLIKSKNLKEVNIIEIGGGYGGLCVILNNLSSVMGITINKYIIYDLDEAQKLQHYYLSNFINIDNIRWKSCDNFGSTLILNDLERNILVSNYCLSEIPDEYKIKYLNNILPKVHGGYLAWNWGDKTGLPIDIIEVPEVPETGPGNTIIKW